VINGLFIMTKKLKEKPPYVFENKGCLGVDSSEIRRILNFGGPLKTAKNYEKFLNAGSSLSALKSEELAWLAQYLMNGRTHLYASEAAKAVQIEKSLTLLCP
jgi:hypothetical protein